MNIKILNLDPRTGDTLVKGCEICNQNFKQLSSKAMLLDVIGIPLSKAIIHIFDVLEFNSKILGYEFVSLKDCVNSDGHIVPKRMFEALNNYFKSLIIRES